MSFHGSSHICYFLLCELSQDFYVVIGCHLWVHFTDFYKIVQLFL